LLVEVRAPHGFREPSRQDGGVAMERHSRRALAEARSIDYPDSETSSSSPLSMAGRMTPARWRPSWSVVWWRTGSRTPRPPRCASCLGNPSGSRLGRRPRPSSPEVVPAHVDRPGHLGEAYRLEGELVAGVLDDAVDDQHRGVAQQ